jgi:hypothetical protein
MMAALPPDAAAKLVKILGMLGSDHDGECIAAARQATRLIKSYNATWERVLAPPQLAPTLPPRPQNYAVAHVAAARHALQYAGHLTAWEAAFLHSITERRRLSPKQEATLTEILAKLRMAGAA